MSSGWWLLGFMTGLLPAAYSWMGRRTDRLVPRAGGEKPQLSIILVLRNMEKRVEGLVRTALAFQDKRFPSGQVVVVNHGSEDQTDLILARMSRGENRLKILSLPARGDWDPQKAGVELSDGLYTWSFILPPEIHPEDLTAALTMAVDGKSQNPLLGLMRFQKNL